MREPTAAAAPGTRRIRYSVQFACPRCGEVFLQPVEEAPGDRRLSCPKCELGFRDGAPGPEPDDPVSRCWVCGNQEFYLQKDFNRQLGLSIAVVSFFVILLVMGFAGHREGILCLVALAVIDWFLYRMLATVTVCYLCQSIYRGFPLNPEHRGFYLGCEEKYKQLRQQWLENITAEK